MAGNIIITTTDNNVEVSMAAVGPQGPRGTEVLTGSVDPTPQEGLIGDQYINTFTGYIFGPKTSEGWGVGVPLGANGGLGSVTWEQFYQVDPAAQWDIIHALPFYPNVTILDDNNIAIEGDIEYVDATTIRATFSEPISGSALLS